MAQTNNQRKNKDSNQDDGEKLLKKSGLIPNVVCSLCRDVINHFVELLPLFCLLYFCILCSLRGFGLIQSKCTIFRQEKNNQTLQSTTKTNHPIETKICKSATDFTSRHIFLHVSQSYFTYSC